MKSQHGELINHIYYPQMNSKHLFKVVLWVILYDGKKYVFLLLIFNAQMTGKKYKVSLFTNGKITSHAKRLVSMYRGVKI